MGNIPYTITTVTGDRDGAGTDAHVRIRIIGDLQDTPSVELDNAGVDDFIRGHTDVFKNLLLPDVGNIEGICIEHDNTGDRPGWYLENVKIERLGEPPWVFSVGRWIAKDEGDGQLRLQIEPQYRPSPQVEPKQLDDKILGEETRQYENDSDSDLKVEDSFTSAFSLERKFEVDNATRQTTERSVEAGTTLKLSDLGLSLKATYKDQMEQELAKKYSEATGEERQYKETFTVIVKPRTKQIVTCRWHRLRERGSVTRGSLRVPYEADIKIDADVSTSQVALSPSSATASQPKVVVPIRRPIRLISRK